MFLIDYLIIVVLFCIIWVVFVVSDRIHCSLCVSDYLDIVIESTFLNVYVCIICLSVFATRLYTYKSLASKLCPVEL